MFILAQFATELPGRLRAMTARMRQFYYVDTLTSTLLDGDSICQSLRIICQYLLTISSVRTALKRSDNDETSQGLPMCNGLHAISSGSVSTGTGFCSVVKMHKQALLGLLRAGNGSIWWGQFRGLGWKNW